MKHNSTSNRDLSLMAAIVLTAATALINTRIAWLFTLAVVSIIVTVLAMIRPALTVTVYLSLSVASASVLQQLMGERANLLRAAIVPILAASTLGLVSRHFNLRASAPLIPWIVTTLALYPFSSQPTRTILYALALTTLAYCIAIVDQKSRTSRASIEGVLIWLTRLLVVSSIVLSTIAPALGTRGGRLQGVLNNPNGLASTLAILSPLCLRSRARIDHYVTLPAIFGLVIFTGSRGGVLALSVGLLASTLLGKHRKIMLQISMPIALAFVTALYATPALRNGLDFLSRRDRTRTEAWSLAHATIQEHPLGVGPGAYDALVGNSYLLLRVELGWAGVAAVGFALAAYGFRSWQSDDRTALIVIAVGLTSSIGESWMAAPGSLGCVLMFLIIATTNRTKGPESSSTAPPQKTISPRTRNRAFRNSRSTC